MNTSLFRTAVTLSLLVSTAAFAAPPTNTVASAVAEAPPKATAWLYEGSDLPPDTSWTFGTLPNGLKYAVKRNEVPAGQVAIRVRIDAGALHEEDNEQGYAHLLEHLVFRGSEHIPEGEAKRIWQRLGVSFGSDSNAQTTTTQTVYKLDLPSASPASLDELMKMLSGMMRAPNIMASAVNAERAIVMAELREAESAQLDLDNAAREHLFQGQRLAKRPTAGTMATLALANVDGLRGFHRRWYRPDNAVVVIAGDVDPALLETQIQRHFGSWKGDGPRAVQPDFGRPKKDGKLSVAVIEPTLPTTAAIAYLRPWQQVDDTVAYNEQLIVDGLAQRIINRRLENMARDGASFTLAQVGQQDVSRTADLTLVNVRPLSNNWEQAVKDVRAVIADALETAPVPDDIARELAIFADEFRTRVDSYPFEAAAKQAEDIVRAVDIRETVVQPQTALDIFDQTKPKVTPERILAATRALFAADATYITLSAPTAPADADKRLAAALMAPVSGNAKARLAAGSLGFDALPPLGKAKPPVSAVVDDSFGIEKLSFANGVRAILSPNKAESGQVRLLVRFGRGFQAVAPNAGGMLWAGPMVLPDNGIGALTRSQIDQMINGRRIELNFTVDNDAFEFASTTRADDVADQLKLIAAKLEHPGWQPAAVERAKAYAISDYDGYAMSALALMQRDLQYQLTGLDMRWKIPPPSQVRTLNPAKFRAYWAPLLASGPIEVLVFGDFDRDKIVAALGESFGAIKPRKAALVPPNAGTMRFPAKLATPLRLTHKGPSDQVVAVIAWPTGGGLSAISEGRELEILAALFRDRLFEKFRAEQAASYSPDMASNWPDEFASGGFLMAYSQVQPKDRDRFFAFAREIAADLAARPIDDDELKRAVEPAKQYVERATSGNMFWITQMEGASYAPQRFAALSRLYSDYAKVTPARIQELAKRYFREDKAWQMVVEPEKKADISAR